MSITRTKATCRCGATIETPSTSELTDWQNRHDQCLSLRATWDGLTKSEKEKLFRDYVSDGGLYTKLINATEAMLKRKNT
jgi:hypothetical protein